MARYKAQIDGFELDIEDISDGREKALVRHEYPYIDGADLSDMGMRARTVSFRCYFLGDKYDLHRGFVVHVEQDRVLQLVHPVYGLLYGRVESTRATHNDAINTAIVDVNFVEERSGEIAIPYDERIVPEIEQAFVDGLGQQATSFVQELQNLLGVARANDLVGQTLTSGSTILSEFSSTTGAVREVVKSIDSDVRAMEDALSSVTQPADNILSTVDLAETLPNRVMTVIAEAVERYAEAAASVVSTPSQLLSSIFTGIDTLANAAPFLASHVRSVGVMYASVYLADNYQADEEKKQVIRKREGQPVWNNQGQLIRDSVIESVYTITELETSLYIIRERLQESYDTFRSVTALKECARLLLYHVSDVKLERDRIITITVDRPTSLFSICMAYGLDHTKAERIVKLNPHIPNPSFCEGEVRIYAS